MRNILIGLTAFTLFAGVGMGVANAADEDTTARVREMLHRTQEALRQAQSDNADLTRAKTDAERKLQAAAQQLGAVQSGSKAAQTSLNAKLASVQGLQADVEHKLERTTDQLAAANTKLGETSQQLAARTAELAEIKQALEQSKTANASCEAKNITLYGYAEAVLQRYKNKGVWASLSQKDPVFGLKQVDVENVLQEYQLKFDSQKAKP
jgi:chromosome segregation ATPase